jgi:hypothetical protein
MMICGDEVLVAIEALQYRRQQDKIAVRTDGDITTSGGGTTSGNPRFARVRETHNFHGLVINEKSLKTRQGCDPGRITQYLSS